MPFTYQRLEVYQVAREFLIFRSEIIRRAGRMIAAIDHLQRSGESIVLNIVHSTETWSARERKVYLAYANGSALECAACLDIIETRGGCSATDVGAGKNMLRSIVNMLIAMRDVAENRIHEARSVYGNDHKVFFSHEKLVAYQKSLVFMAGLDPLLEECRSSSDLATKLDKSSTSIILNIAEGNGRFSATDQERFLATAHRSLVQTAALLDMAEGVSKARRDRGLNQLDEISRLLQGLRRSIHH